MRGTARHAGSEGEGNVIDVNRLQPTVFAGSIFRLESSEDEADERSPGGSYMLSTSPKVVTRRAYEC